MERMHALILDLEAAERRESEYALAAVLIRESAMNILTAYIRTSETAEPLVAMEP